MLGHDWNQFGTIWNRVGGSSGSFWTILTSFGDTFEIILEHVWKCLKSSWDNLELILKQCWNYLGTNVKSFWDYFEIIWKLFWNILGKMKINLGNCWNHSGINLVTWGTQFGPSGEPGRVAGNRRPPDTPYDFYRDCKNPKGTPGWGIIEIAFYFQRTAILRAVNLISRRKEKERPRSPA